MPDFTFTSPDNKQYTVSGPDGATKEQAFQILQSQLGNAPQSPAMSGGAQALDIAKGAGTGLAEGAMGLAGLPGDIASLMNRGVDWGLGKVGITPPPGAAPTNYDFGTSGQIQRGVESVAGKLPQPETTAGKIAQTAGSFVPAMIGGPEGLVTKALTRVAAPTLGAEAAGALTNDNPYAKVVGALAGGMGAAKTVQGLAARSAASGIPTGEELLNTAGNQFNAARNSGLTITPDAAETIADKIKAGLLRDGYHPDSQPQVFNALDRLAGYGVDETGALKPVTMNEMESVRKALVNSKMSPDGSVRNAAKTATKQLLDEQAALSPTQVLTGNAADYNATLKDAIGNYAAGKRSNTVMGKAALADLNAGTAGSGANIDNASRQAIKQLARPINNDIVPVAKRMGFNDDEVTAINRAARGTVTGNIARYLGKAAPTGIVSGLMSSGAGHMVGGPVGAVGLPVAGYVAKKIGDLSTKRAIDALDSLVRSRSPLAVHVAAQLPSVTKQLPPSTTALLTAMLASTSLRQPVAQPVQYQR